MTHPPTDGLFTQKHTKAEQLTATSSDFDFTLPPDLEKISLERFDTLLEQKAILYEPPRIDIVCSDIFPFHFSTTSALGAKPILSENDPGRTKAIGPFVESPEKFIVARIGTSHKIIVNKYCVYKPMLILHTTLFEPQTNDLNALDIAIAWSMLKSFATTPQMVIYNCGVESGSSQGHKHLQMFPRQDSEGFEIWPEKCSWDGNGNGNCAVNTSIPFAHFLRPLNTEASAADVFEIYQDLLAKTKRALRQVGAGTDYNLILVPRWILLIPRTTKGRGRLIMNAANMVGLMWTKSEEVRDEVIGMGVGFLAELGIPVGRGSVGITGGVAKEGIRGE